MGNKRISVIVGHSTITLSLVRAESLCLHKKGIPEGFWQLIHSTGTLDTPSLGHVVLFLVDSGG